MMHDLTEMKAAAPWRSQTPVSDHLQFLQMPPPSPGRIVGPQPTRARLQDNQLKQHDACGINKRRVLYADPVGAPHTAVSPSRRCPTAARRSSVRVDPTPPNGPRRAT